MPEIVELRTDADYLDKSLSSHNMVKCGLLTESFSKKCKGVLELQTSLPLKVLKVRSRAKKLFIFLENDFIIYIQYGMTGGMYTDKSKHAHIHFGMDNGVDIYYTDVRKIGSVRVSDSLDTYAEEVTDMGEPIALGYDEAHFGTITKENFRKNIKNCKKSYLVAKIMDQRSICSGVGNYLLSEIMYDAGLHPDIRCNELDENMIERLWTSCHKIILDSYKYGGMSMSDYKHVSGEKGQFESQVKVYNKDGEKDVNGKEIQKKKGKHGRTIWFI